MLTSRDNNFNREQLRGVDLTVKSVAKKYPFIKGWSLAKDSDKYHLHLYINLIVDYNELAKFYNTEIHPLFADGTFPLESSLTHTFLKTNPMTLTSTPEYKKFFDESFRETQKIKNSMNQIYQLLPDELSIFYTSEFLGKDNVYKVTLEPDKFKDINIV